MSPMVEEFYNRCHGASDGKFCGTAGGNKKGRSAAERAAAAKASRAKVGTSGSKVVGKDDGPRKPNPQAQKYMADLIARKKAGKPLVEGKKDAPKKETPKPSSVKPAGPKPAHGKSDAKPAEAKPKPKKVSPPRSGQVLDFLGKLARRVADTPNQFQRGEQEKRRLNPRGGKLFG
jgi:hypothetical protein